MSTPLDRTGIAKDVLTLLAVGTLFLWFGWVGYIGSDDHFYMNAGIGWLDAFPYLGEDHWSLRYPVVIPISLSFVLLGINEPALIAPTILYFSGLLIISYFLLRRLFDRSTAFLSVGLMAALPIFSVHFTTPVVEAPEVFFAAASFLVFLIALNSSRETLLLVISGSFAALAFATRETSVSLIVAYGLLFLIGYGISRWSYLKIAVGFFLVYGIEWLYLSLLSGDPLYRLRIDFFHDTIERNIESGGLLDEAGNITISPLLDPFFVIFLNQEFGLLFIVGVAVTIIWLRKKNAFGEYRETVLPFIVLWLANFIFISVLSNLLQLSARYFSIAAFAVAVIIATWLVEAYRQGSRRLSILIGALLLLSFLAGSYLENKDYLFPERKLVELSCQRDERIYTDPKTLFRASFLLTISGCADNVTDAPPQSGGLFYSVPRNLEQYRQSERWFQPEPYIPRADWSVVEKIETKKKLVGLVLKWLSLDSLIPEDVFKKLYQPIEPIMIYRAVDNSQLTE